MEDVSPETMPASLADLVERLDRLRVSGQREPGASVGAIPTTHYFSEERWRDEQAALFGRMPIVAAHSSELPPCSALPFDALGVPIVLTRSVDGRARAFLNVCRHRGMALLQADGNGNGNGNGGAKAKSCGVLVCPYHGWSYELDGRLRHRLHADSFDGIDPAGLNLAELPCDEAGGLIFVQRAPGPAFSAASYLQDLEAHLGWFGLPGFKVFRKADRLHRANWKLLADAFLEGYHLRVLHRKTIAPLFADAYSVNLRAGRHLSFLVARRSAFEPFERPRDLEALCRISAPTQFIFPNTFLIWHPEGVSLIGMFSPAPDQMRWLHTLLIPPDKAGAEWATHWENIFLFTEQTVFEREDVATAITIQAGLRSGANQGLLAGRLESEILRFHGGIGEEIAASAR